MLLKYIPKASSYLTLNNYSTLSVRRLFSSTKSTTTTTTMVEPGRISANALKEAKQSKVPAYHHFDVRNTAELQETGTIPNAFHVPLPTLHQSHLPQNKNSPIVFSCKSGMRSMKACIQAQEWGYTNVHNLDGGFMGWKESSLPVLPYVGTPIVKCFHDQETGTCQYIVSCPDTKSAVIVDPVLDFNLRACVASNDNADKILAYVRELGLNVTHILETHAHADHISSSQYLKSKLNGKPLVCIGELITKVQNTFEPIFNVKCKNGKEFDHLFKPNEEFKVGNIAAKALHVPGHTPDHLCYVIGNSVFTGDSLFMPESGSARCDFPGGSAHQLFNSIRNVLFQLDDNFMVFVGHDYPSDTKPLAYQTTIGEEKKSNKHLNLSIGEEEFLKMREERDKTLGNPNLLFPSLQCNIKAGHLPEELNSKNQVLLKLPVSIKYNL